MEAMSNFFCAPLGMPHKMFGKSLVLANNSIYLQYKIKAWKRKYDISLLYENRKIQFID